MGATQLLQHAPAIEFRQVHIQNYQVICLLLRQMQSIGASGRVVNDITTFRQSLMQVFGSFKLVLDDKDSHDLSPLLFNGYLIKVARKVVVFVGASGRI
jgi:hypothetical protein